MTLEFERRRTVKLDSTMAFGFGYDYSGLERAEEADGVTGTFLLWQSGDCSNGYSLYRDTDGGFCTYDNREDAIAAAEKWDTEDIRPRIAP
jgi:hypothetical protein